MLSVAKFSRLNLKELTILRVKKTKHEMQLCWLLTMWQNLGQDQHILLTHHCANPIPGFLVSSSHPLSQLQIFPYLKILLLYVLIHA